MKIMRHTILCLATIPFTFLGTLAVSRNGNVLFCSVQASCVKTKQCGTSNKSVATSEAPQHSTDLPYDITPPHYVLRGEILHTTQISGHEVLAITIMATGVADYLVHPDYNDAKQNLGSDTNEPTNTSTNRFTFQSDSSGGALLAKDEVTYGDSLDLSEYHTGVYFVRFDKPRFSQAT